MKRGRIEVVLFDMDGVIFEGKNFWLDLHHAYGTAEEGVRLADDLMLRDYDELAEHVAGRLWKGRPAAAYLRLIAERRYSEGVRDVFGFLRANEVKTAIVSSGPYELALRAQADLGVDAVRANRLHIHEGLLTGGVDLGMREADKAAVGKEVAASLGGSLRDAAFVGDSDGDVELARQAKVAIAYDTRSAALKSVEGIHVLPKGKLADLIPILAPCIHPRSPTDKARAGNAATSHL